MLPNFLHYTTDGVSSLALSNVLPLIILSRPSSFLSTFLLQVNVASAFLAVFLLKTQFYFEKFIAGELSESFLTTGCLMSLE